jgi:hypothetical protein
MSAPDITLVCTNTNSENTATIIGHGPSSLTSIQMLVTPSIHALIPNKAMAFDFLFNHQVSASHLLIHAMDLTTALSNHF